MNIYIIYSENDIFAFKTIKNWLIGLDNHVYALDSHKGGNIELVYVSDKIGESDVVLFLGSHSSSTDEKCRLHLEEAFRLKKRIIPVNLNKTVVLPDIIAGLTGVDFSIEVGDHFSRLLTSIYETQRERQKSSGQETHNDHPETTRQPIPTPASPLPPAEMPRNPSHQHWRWWFMAIISFIAMLAALLTVPWRDIFPQPTPTLMVAVQGKPSLTPSSSSTPTPTATAAPVPSSTLMGELEAADTAAIADGAGAYFATVLVPDPRLDADAGEYITTLSGLNSDEALNVDQRYGAIQATRFDTAFPGETTTVTVVVQGRPMVWEDVYAELDRLDLLGESYGRIGAAIYTNPINAMTYLVVLLAN